jgi:hypothetical protein
LQHFFKNSDGAGSGLVLVIWACLVWTCLGGASKVVNKKYFITYKKICNLAKPLQHFFKNSDWVGPAWAETANCLGWPERK